MRQALGVAVFFGMIGVTVFGLLFTPTFYVINKIMGERAGDWAKRFRKPGRGEPVVEGDLA